MISFVMSEFKSAVVWVKETLVRIGAWMFRWILRWVMLAGIFLLLAKGCHGIFSVMDPFIQSKQDIQSGSGSGQSPASGVSPAQNDAFVPENHYGRIAVPEKEKSLPEKARSSWSALRYIGGDLMRWFKKR